MNLRDHFFRSEAARKFNSPVLEIPVFSTFEGVGGGRFYETPAGALPSVTTVLSATEDKEWVKAWVARVGTERAEAISKAGADRGTYVHGLIERYLRNETIDKSEHPASYFWMFQRIRRFLDRIDDIVALEAAVFSRRLRYAGRLDCSASFDGRPSLIDFKNYSKPKTRDQLDTAFTQACMYAFALEETALELFGIEMKHENLVIIFSSESEHSDAIAVPRQEFEAKALERIARYHAERSA